MTWLVTGVCAAGKTAVGRLLAERLGLAFVEGDAVRPPGNGPSEERYRALVDAGRGGVCEDVVLGPWLAWVAEELAPCRVVVLAPSPEVVRQRDDARTKEGYADWRLDELDRSLREDTPLLGLWLDTSEQTPEETVAEILDRADEALV